MDAEQQKLALVREEGARYGTELARQALQTELEPDVAIARVVSSLREAAARIETEIEGEPDFSAAWLSGALHGVEVEVQAHFDGKRLRHGEPQ